MTCRYLSVHTPRMPKPKAGPRKATSEPTVKTSIKLPEELWRQAHIRGLHDRMDLQDVIAEALKVYLRQKDSRA